MAGAPALAFSTVYAEDKQMLAEILARNLEGMTWVKVMHMGRVVAYYLVPSCPINRMGAWCPYCDPAPPVQ